MEETRPPLDEPRARLPSISTYFDATCRRLHDQPRVEEIARHRADELDKQSFEDQVACRGYPVIITDFLLKTSLHGFTFADLIARIGDFTETSESKPATISDEQWERAAKSAPATLGDYIERFVLVDDGRPVEPYFYYRNVALTDRLIQALELPAIPYVAPGELRAPRLWIGKRGTHANLHGDTNDNFILQIMGGKRLTLYPPRDACYLYLERAEQAPVAVTPSGYPIPTSRGFPLLCSARPVTVVLQAGQLLYLPVGWVHHVENLENSLMVNHWLVNNHLPLVLRHSGGHPI